VSFDDWIVALRGIGNDHRHARVLESRRERVVGRVLRQQPVPGQLRILL
jgi:hypothetical protein